MSVRTTWATAGILAVASLPAVAWQKGYFDDHPERASAGASHIRSAASAALPEPLAVAQPLPSPEPAPRARPSAGLRIYPGFEADRYQQHDSIIKASVDDLNRDMRRFPGYQDLDPDLVKAIALVESGGESKRSRAAWETDPLQSRRDNAYTDFQRGRGGLPRYNGAHFTDVVFPANSSNLAERSIRRGVFVLAKKATPLDFDKETGALTVRDADRDGRGDFHPWLRAAELYNGGGAAKHGQSYRSMLETLYLRNQAVRR